MDRSDQLSGQELDQLLRGEPLEGRPHLRSVADLAAAVRSHAHAEPAPVMRYELRRAIAERAAPPPPSRARRRWLDAVTASAAVLAFGAVGAAGALPAPLQNAVSGAGGVVGVELPRADDAADEAPGVQVAAALLGEPEDEGTEPKAAAPPDLTPGGAAPADPGEPGDQEPATPAVPPAGAQGQDPEDTGAAAGERVPGSGNASDRAQVPDGAGTPTEPPGPPAKEPTETDEPNERVPGPVRPPLG